MNSQVFPRKCVISKRNTANDFRSRCLVGVAGVEPTASWTRTKRATNCATPRHSLPIIRNYFLDVKRTSQKSLKALIRLNLTDEVKVENE